MDIKNLLRDAELFAGLTDDELNQVAAICTRRQLKKGEAVARQGEAGRDLFIVSEGLLEVSVIEGDVARVVINLGAGQLIGEMALVDHGPRSATVTAVQDPTIVQVIKHDEFESLCQRNTQIGYRVMQNLAVDLSFKLRHRNLSED